MVHSSVKDLEFLSHTHPPVFLSALIFLILCEMQGHGQLPSPIFLSPFCNGSQLKSQFTALRHQPNKPRPDCPVALLLQADAGPLEGQWVPPSHCSEQDRAVSADGV